MVPDNFMGQLQLIAALQPRLVQQERRQPLVKAFPHDLLHQPHDLGKPAGHDLIGIVGQGSGRLHHALINFRGDQPKVGIPLGFYGDVKLDAVHHAGGRKQTDIHFKQPVKGDFPSLFRENICPQLPGTDQKQPCTVRRTVVKNGSFFYALAAGRPQKRLLLLQRQLIPYRKILCKLHRSPPGPPPLSPAE